MQHKHFQPPLVWVDFPQEFGTQLQRFSITHLRHPCWAIRPSLLSMFWFILKLLNGVWGQGSLWASEVSPTPNSENYFLGLCTMACSCKQKRAPWHNRDTFLINCKCKMSVTDYILFVFLIISACGTWSVYVNIIIIIVVVVKSIQ